MKKTFLLLMMMAVCGAANAQCVATVKDVVQDDLRGSIVVKTEYVLNGKVVNVDAAACVLKDGKYFNGSKECIGSSRYDEGSGTNEEIITKAKEDVALHCENLIRRIEANQTFREAESLKIQKALTAPIILSIKDSLVGFSTSKTEVVDEFKGQQIKVTADAKNTVTAISAIESK
jgi:hypothetical protein